MRPPTAFEGFGEAIGEVFIPEERVDLATAIGAFTMGSAYVNHLDRLTGSIEVGKYADLTVIDQNLFEIPAIEMPEGAGRAHVRRGRVRLRRRERLNTG